ncbi:MAG: magnesium transporter [Armatimonadetes bacterium]|nr:magnesium transporter [Armatimonadota bacterium]
MSVDSLYLSQLLNARVVDADGRRVGWVVDAVVRPGELFPAVVGLVVRRAGAPTLRLAWSSVGAASERQVRLRTPAAEAAALPLREGEILLRAEVLDRQLVDTHDRRVVKVNDLRLVFARGELRVVGVDVSGRGILRRLGLERLAGRTLPEALIPWNYVESIPGRGADVRLSVPSSRLERLHPADISRILGQLSAEDRAAAVMQFSDETLAEALGGLDAATRSAILEELDDRRASSILAHMAPDEATDLLQDLPEERQTELLTRMGSEDAAALSRLLRYDEQSAGGLMTTEFIALPAHLTAQEAITRVRELAPKAETIYYLYVVDDEGRLMGVLSLFRLLTSPPEQPIAASMTAAVIAVPATMDQEEVAATIAKYRLLAVPVIDEQHRLLGIVTVDDTIDVVDEEAKEDVSHIAGTPTETVAQLQRSRAIAFHRLPWMLLALTAGLLGASVLHRFGGPALARAILFLPLLLLVGNQAAARAAAVTARGIALHAVDRANWWARLVGELKATVPVALAVGLAGGLAGAVWGGAAWGLLVGLAAAAMALIGTGLGMLVPLARAAVRLDPAEALRPVVVSLLAITAPLVYAGFLRLLG